jgi:DnaJ-class molecular chaperone
MTPLVQHHAEHCRACGGKGGWSDPPAQYWSSQRAWVRCEYCGDTGRQSIMIGEKE